MNFSEKADAFSCGEITQTRFIQPLRCSYFLRKDLQSVHWSTVGLASWVPTRIRSREQKFAESQWLAHWVTVHSTLLLA